MGIATLLEGNEVYGPALARAYELETKAAEYPRFVVGDGLLRFLDGFTGQAPATIIGEAAKETAVRCRRMITQDTDGRQMLDFLSEEMKAPTPFEVYDLVARGLAFVQGEYERFQRSGNDKLASRDYRLLQYYLARKKIWVL